MRKAYGRLTVADGIDLSIGHGELAVFADRFRRDYASRAF